MNKFNADLIGPDNTISSKDTELYSEEKNGMMDEAVINEELKHDENIKNLNDILDQATHKIVLIRRLLEES